MASIPMPRELQDETDLARDYRAKHEPLFDGMHAGRIGVQAGANPYTLGTPEYADWFRGWQTTSTQAAAAQVSRAEKARQIAADMRSRAKKLCDPCTCNGKGLCKDAA